MTSLPHDLDLTALSDGDLLSLRRAADREASARAARERIPQQMAQLNAAYTAALGRQPGDPWTQPQGAHDAYAEGAVVSYEGGVWTNLLPFNVWAPGVAGWREEPAVPGDGGGEDGGEEPTLPATPADWVQPAGAFDAYKTGDLVTFDGTVYRSTMDGNVWSPSTYPAAWEAIDWPPLTL